MSVDSVVMPTVSMYTIMTDRASVAVSVVSMNIDRPCDVVSTEVSLTHSAYNSA